MKQQGRRVRLQVETLESRCLLSGSGNGVAIPHGVIEGGAGAPQGPGPVVTVQAGLQAAASPLDLVKPTKAQIIAALNKLLAAANTRQTSVASVLTSLNEQLSKLKPGDRDYFDTVRRIKRYEAARDQLAADVSNLNAILKDLSDGKITPNAAMDRLHRLELAWNNQLTAVEAEIKKTDEQLAKIKPTDPGYFDLLLKRSALEGKMQYQSVDLIALVEAITMLITGKP